MTPQATTTSLIEAAVAQFKTAQTAEQERHAREQAVREERQLAERKDMEDVASRAAILMFGPVASDTTWTASDTHRATGEIDGVPFEVADRHNPRLRARLTCANGHEVTTRDLKSQAQLGNWLVALGDRPEQACDVCKDADADVEPTPEPAPTATFEEVLERARAARVRYQAEQEGEQARQAERDAEWQAELFADAARWTDGVLGPVEPLTWTQTGDHTAEAQFGGLTLAYERDDDRYGQTLYLAAGGCPVDVCAGVRRRLLPDGGAGLLRLAFAVEDLEILAEHDDPSRMLKSWECRDCDRREVAARRAERAAKAAAEPTAVERLADAITAIATEAAREVARTVVREDVW